MANLKLTGVQKTYAGALNVLDDSNLNIVSGDLIVFVGAHRVVVSQPI